MTAARPTRASGLPIVFLDKDGTLVENVPYNVDPARIRLADGGERALIRLHTAGFRIAVISNQPAIARGFFAEHALLGVRARLEELLAALGVPLAGLYYCPHDPHGIVPALSVRCNCRKPAPGLLRRAARELGADLRRSWMVGDILDDVEAGRRAGCFTVLLDNGGETEWILTAYREPDYVVYDLLEAADLIVSLTEAPAAGSVARSFA